MKTPKSRTRSIRPWISDAPIGFNEDALGSVVESLDKGDIELFEDLTLPERQFVLSMMKDLEKGDISKLEAMFAIDYERMPVEAEVFFTESDYMGHIGKDIYRAWWGHLLKCADQANGIYELILTGSIGSGKTTLAMLLLAYRIYRLSCLKDPAQHFGLASKSRIVFGVYSLTLGQAEDVGFYKLQEQMIDTSPYFREVFPRRPYGKDFIEWPQKAIKVITGSSALHAVGRDLYSIVIDEINLFAKGKATAHKAHDLANAVSRRLESRFMTGMGSQDMPGICIFIASKRAETDYLDQRMKKVRGLKGVHIVDGPVWEFLAGDKIKYCGTTFRVLLGDATHDAQILDEVEVSPSGKAEVVPSLSQYEEARLEGKIIDVPVEHYKAFVEDVIGAIQDVAGISTSATVTFFPRKKVITEMFTEGADLPRYFASETIVMPIRSPIKLTELFDLDLACAVNLSQRTPYRHPRSPRYIHIDLARNDDAVGIVMLHPSEFIIQKGDDVQGTQEESVEKTLEVDFIIRVITDDTGEDVDFRKIEEFIVWLRKNGFWIRRVTFDSFQSANSIQALKTFGIDAGVRSTQRSILPYRILQRTMRDRNIIAPKNDFLKKELGELIYRTDKDQVDHPEGGSNDCADALAGASYECMLDKLTPADVAPSHVPAMSTRYDSYLDDIENVRL